MKTYLLAAMAVILMSGSAIAYPSSNPFNRPGLANPYNRPGLAKSFDRPVLTPYERIQIQRSQFRLNALEFRARADGRVTFWERAQIRLAHSRHNALVYRLTHN